MIDKAYQDGMISVGPAYNIDELRSHVSAECQSYAGTASQCYEYMQATVLASPVG